MTDIPRDIPRYNLPPPNDAGNNPDDDLTIDALRVKVSTGNSNDVEGGVVYRHVNTEMIWTPKDYIQHDDGSITPAELIRPVLWNGWHFTIFVRQHQELITALEILAASDWDHQFRGKVKGLIPQVFNEFLSLPQDIPPGSENPHWCNNPGKAKMQFSSVQGLIADWCMADFCWHRELWGWAKPFEPLDISGVPLPDNWESEIVINSGSKRNRDKPPKPKQPTAKEKRAAELAAMTPEQRRIRLASEATRRKLAAMKREGKINERVLEVIEIAEFMDQTS